MANHENLSTPFIYLRSTGEKISVTKEQRDALLVASIVGVDIRAE